MHDISRGTLFIYGTTRLFLEDRHGEVGYADGVWIGTKRMYGRWNQSKRTEEISFDFKVGEKNKPHPDQSDSK